jgi:hypothetical protein
MKVTVPVGTQELDGPVPLATTVLGVPLGVTVAVKVRLLPGATGFADAETAAVAVSSTGSTNVV